MLSYDSPMPANKGHKDTVNALAAASAAATTSSPSSASNGLAINGTSISNYKHHHIWLVTGPAGCGKSTVAEFISSKLHMPYIEGDAVRIFHPPRLLTPPFPLDGVYSTGCPG